MNDRDTKSSWMSFSLLNLMALATIVAVWLPWWLARDEPERLQGEIDFMNQSLGRLVINDPAEFEAVQLADFTWGMETWRFHVPEDMNIDACLATDGIHKLALPEEFQSFTLPSGQHEMSLLFRKHAKNGFNFEVHLDGKRQLKIKHPDGWVQSSGWSSTGSVSKTAAVYDMATPVVMKRLVYSHTIHTKNSGSIYLTEDSASSSKGCYFWLQPAGHVAEPAPDWLDETSRIYPTQIGHREGVRLRSLTSPSPGLQIHHPACMTRQTPVVTLFMEFESDEADLSLSSRNQNTGTWKLSGSLSEFVKPDLVTKNQSKQSLFLIHELNMKQFATAKPPVPIVEILFDLDRPDDIGFRLVPPKNGIAVDRWKIHAVHHLGQYWQSITTTEGQWRATDDPSTLALPSFPEVQHNGAKHRAIEIRSPIEDMDEWDKLNVPRGVRFESYPQRHTWLLPEATDTDGPSTSLSVKVSGGIDDQSIAPMPGGPVISELTLDIERPNDTIQWYRIEVQR